MIICVAPPAVPMTLTVPPPLGVMVTGDLARGLGARMAWGGVMASVASVDVPIGRIIWPATGRKQTYVGPNILAFFR